MNKFICKIIGVLIYLTLGLQIIGLFIFLTPAIANAQQTDSIKVDDGKDNKKVEQLKEVVVEAAARKDIDQGVAFFPTKREKNLATDATNLIQMMALTELPFDYRKGTVTDATGNSVNYFIDGREASQKDLKAMNPKDVDRVEYLPMPTSGNFIGKQNVVNFVMKKYITGGYTRFNALQYLDGRYGDYSLSSRLAHKEMTFDLFFDGAYLNRENTGSIIENTYKGITYQGTLYDKLLESIDNTHNKSKKSDLGAFLKARWDHRALSLTTTIGWSWQQVPESENISATSYLPSAINSSAVNSGNNSLSINPYAKILMMLDLPHSQSLSLSLSGQYMSEKASSFYNPLNLDPIFNATKDKSWTGYASLSYSKQFNPKNSLELMAFFSLEENNTDYAGSYTGDNKYRSATEMFEATYSHTFRRGTYLSLSAGFENVNQKVNSDNENQLTPRTNLSFSHKWNSKSNLRISSGTFLSGYNGNVRNDVILRVSELVWRRGNPDLKDRLWWQSSISNTWNFTNNFSLTLNTLYTRIFHNDNTVWEVADGRDGLVRYLSSNGNADRITAGARTTLKLFNKKLVLTGSFEYNFLKLTGNYHRTHPFFDGSFSATWYGKNWFVAAVLVPGTTQYNYNKIEKVYDNWKYYVNFGYNIKNLNLRLNIYNPFGSKWTTIRTVSTEHFSQRQQAYSCFASNRFSLTAIYTLSYGKKVSRTTLQKASMMESGAMLAE